MSLTDTTRLLLDDYDRIAATLRRLDPADRFAREHYEDMRARTAHALLALLGKPVKTSPQPEMGT